MNHFLLIDDDAVFARIMQRAFARQQLDLAWAPDAHSALAHTLPPQGIILDLNLAGDNGLQLLPSLKERFPASKIVVLTGYASISTAVSAVKLGADQYLPKPADVPTILQALLEPEIATTAPIDTPLPEQGPSLQRLKWEHIQFVLQQNEGNISATARALNMHRRTLQRMLAKHPAKK